MTWENCHEYFLSKEFREENEKLSPLLEDLSAAIKTSNRSKQRKTALQLISIINNKEVPKVANEFVGSPAEVGNYLNNLSWNPVKIFCESDGNRIKIIAIR